MSYRSAISVPEISSGNVGATFTALNANQVVFVQNVSTTLTTLALPAGVWSVVSAFNLNLNGATAFGNGFVNLTGSFPQNAGDTLLWFTSTMTDTTTLYPSGLDTGYVIGTTITLASPSVITLSFLTDSGSGSGNITDGSLVAVKLA